jgi:hypothetical protein
MEIPMFADNSNFSPLIVLLVIAGFFISLITLRCVYSCWVHMEEDQQKREPMGQMTQWPARELAMQQFGGRITAKELERRLKESHLMFTRRGELLSIRVVGVPSGWVAIEWMLDPSLPEALWVKGRRGPTVVFREYAYRGMFTDILKPGEEYKFSLRVYDHDVEVDCVRFTIKIPSRKQWNRSFAPLPAPATARREREFQRLLPMLIDRDHLDMPQGGYEFIDCLKISVVEKKYFKARLHRQLEIERDNEDGEPPRGRY